MKAAAPEHRLAARVALLDAENDRLKHIIVDYESRFAKALNSKRSSSVCQDFSDDSQLEALGLAPSSRRRVPRESPMPHEAKATIVCLEERIEQLIIENKRLAIENMQVRQRQSMMAEKENQRFSQEMQVSEFTAIQNKQLCNEIEVLRETVKGPEGQK
jgi:hypothetical protein